MWVAFANANATHIISAKILTYMPYLMISFNDMLTIVSNNWAQISNVRKQQQQQFDQIS